MLDVARRPPLPPTKLINDRNDLGGMLQAVLELAFREQRIVHHHRDGAGACGSFNRQCARHDHDPANSAVNSLRKTGSLSCTICHVTLS